MSGENTEEPQDPGEDATTDVPVSGDDAASAPPPVAPGPAVPGVEPFAVPAPETVAIPDAEAAIEGFEVPPPPRFGATPPASSAPPIIPPAPSDKSAASGNSAADEADAADGADAPALRKRSTWAPNDTWTSASAHKQEAVPPTAAQKAESRAAASRAATARDEATRNYVSPAAGGTEGISYRGWTVTIFAALAVLLIGAIVLIGFLVGSASSASASSDVAAAALSTASHVLSLT